MRHEAVTAEVDRLIRECSIHLDEGTRTLTWSTDSQAETNRIKALKSEIVARLRELQAAADAANGAYVREKALERIVQFKPSTMAERTLEARRKPAEARMAEAQGFLDEWRRAGIRPFVEWRTSRIGFFYGEHGPALLVPAYLRMEVLWLLRETIPALQRDVPGLRWLESSGGGAA